MSKKILIEIKNLNYNIFDQKIINNINLNIYEGDFIILVGPNGSGKSTLLKIINGLIKAQSGTILLNKKNIMTLAMHKRAHDIATLTQDINQATFSELSVLMNLKLASRKILRKKNREEQSAYIALFNKALEDKLDIPAGHLSGGQRQALALAMCCAHTPKLLLLDEHTSALDPQAAQSLMALTYAHVRKKHLTTVMITHSLDDAMHYGDRLIAMSEGAIKADLFGDEKARLTKSDLIKLAY
jgi:putative ABC transport system ATP-binding protein